MNPGWAPQAWVPVIRDIVLSTIVVLVLWLIVPAPTGPLRLTQIGLGVIAVIGVALRQRLNRLGFVLAATVTAAASALGLTDDPFLLAGAALYSVAATRGQRVLSPWSVGLVFTGLLASAVVTTTGFEERVQYVLFSSIVLMGAWALGVNTRTAKKLAVENAIVQERTRLARDVHDVLSHSDALKQGDVTKVVARVNSSGVVTMKLLDQAGYVVRGTTPLL
jgi:signal transduction histidine kinase